MMIKPDDGELVLDEDPRCSNKDTAMAGRLAACGRSRAVGREISTGQLDDRHAR